MKTEIYKYYEDFLKKNLTDQIPSSVLLDFPTGSGKTYNTFKIVYKNLKNDEHGVFLTPLRASALELYDKFKDLSMISIRIGGFRAGPPLEKAKITIATPEAIYGIFSEWKKNIIWISNLKYLIVDEIHLINQKDRGWLSEMLLSRVMRVNPFCKIIGLSATPGKSFGFLKKTGAIAVRNTKRPVPLEITLKTYSEQNKNEILLSLSDSDKPSIVFVHGRKKTEKLSGFLRKNKIKSDFHHAGLSKKIRKQKEDDFKNGKIKILIATPTLENGVNLPARRVILYDLYYVEDDSPVLINSSTVMQRIGRAGRPEFDDKGEGIILVSKRDRKAQTLIYKEFNDILSSNTKNKVKLFILHEINDFYSDSSDSLYRAWKTLPASYDSEIPDFDKELEELNAAGFIRVKSNKIYTTPIVKTALKYFGDPFFFKYIADFLQYPLTVVDLLILAAVSLKSGLPGVDENDILEVVKFFSGIKTNILNDSKLISRIFKGGKRFSDILEALNVIRFFYFDKNKEDEDPYEIKRIKDEVSGILRGFLRFSTFAEIDFFPGSELKIKTAAASVKGLPPLSAELCLIKGIGEKRAALLMKNNITSLKILSETSVKRLKEIGIPLKIAESASEKAASFIKKLNSEQKSEIKNNYEKPCVEIDIYRFERALKLDVTRISNCEFVVKGGKNEHFVKSGKCDCPDFKNGNTCKHLMAVAINNVRSSTEYDLKNENLFYLFLKVIRDCKIFNRV